MKDIMQKLAELEATAPKVTKKKMLNEDSTTPPMNVSNKPASLKDVFAALSENVVAGQRPIPVLDPQNKQAGMGFVTSNNPAVQNMLKALDPKDVQIVQAPGQPGQQPAGQQQQQAPAAGKSNPNQLQSGQQAMQEEQLDELSPETIKAARDKRLGQLSSQAGATGPKTLSAITNPQFAKPSAATVNKYWDQEKARQGQNNPQVLNPHEQPGYNRGKASPDELANWDKAHPQGAGQQAWDARTARGIERNRQRDLSRGKMVNVAAKKLQGIANVPAKSVAEGAKVDRMVKHIEKSERDLGKSKEKASDIAWATANKRGMLDNKNKKKVKEGDIAPTSSIDTRGAGLGAGRSQTTLEGKKPDFLDLDKDGNKKEPMKKAAADKKKKKVDESMNHRISAARFEGKSHGLKGHAHCGKSYEDLEEMKAYHEGYKEGLDECYGQGVYETAMPATVPGMASAAMPAMEDEMEEGNAFTAALAKTPKGGKFSVGGKTFTDRTGYDAKVNEYAFESLDQQLNALLTESEEVTEGLSVSISKGQQNSPDSVTITAQDEEAEHLLAFVKNAGLGLFGDDHDHSHSSAMSIQPAHGEPDEVGAGGVDVEVVDGNDGIMGLMQKLSGIQAAGADDYEDEEGDEEQLHGNHEVYGPEESPCNECGMMECSHGGRSTNTSQDSDTTGNATVSEENLDEFLDISTTVANKGQSGDATGSSGGASSGAAGGSSGVSGVGATGGASDATASNTNKNQQDAQAAAAANGNAGTGGSTITREEESEDQMEFEVSEDNAPDSDEAETSADEEAEAKEDAALAGAAAKDEEEVNESFASLLERLTKLAEGSGDGPKHAEHDKKDDKDHDDAEEEEEVNESQLNELSPDLLDRAEAKATSRSIQAAKSGKGVDTEYDYSKPGAKFWDAKANKFASARDKASARDSEKAEYKKQTANMSPAQKRQYDAMNSGTQVNEWANQVGDGPGKGTDAGFEQDIDFMTKVIAGGLNKPKSTGQTTVPVIAGQESRMHDHQGTVSDSVDDWVKLAGIK